MTQDVDILSPRAAELAEELRIYLSQRFHIAVRIRTVADGLGHRLYQVREPQNRHLVDIRAVDGLPRYQVVEEILVVPPADLIGQKVQSMVNRSKTAKGATDLADIRRLLLTFPDLKAREGSVADRLRASGRRNRRSKPGERSPLRRSFRRTRDTELRLLDNGLALSSSRPLPMIRAIIQNGQIQPLDPLPEDWTEGRHVIVEDADSTPSDDLEEWYRELRELGPAQYEPGRMGTRPGNAGRGR